MSSMPAADNGVQSAEALRQLAQQKEDEWRRVQELRVQSLEAAVLTRDQALTEERARLTKLKQDFKYNLQLLNDRHEELETYDAVLTELKSTVAGKDAEISDLKIRIDDLSNGVTRESRAKDELQSHYQHRLREKQAEVEQYRSAKDAEIQKEREELETFKRTLERQLRETEGDLDTQRRELMAGFDDNMRKREHENRVQIDELRNSVKAHEIKVKLLTKELEIVRSAQAEDSAQRAQSEGAQRHLEKQLQQKHWELQDSMAMKEARISELESLVKKLELELKTNQEDYQRKHNELDRCLHEKEAIVAKVREASQEREDHLLQKLRALEGELESERLQNRQLAWTNKDLEREKEAEVKKLESELADLQAKWELHTATMSHGSAARDLELDAMRDRESKLRVELTQRMDDITRYKQELQTAMEQHSQLERDKAQLDLDWQRRYEDLESNTYERSEDLIKSLTTAKNEALADLKAKERDLSEKSDLVQVLTDDRDRAMATLKQHGLVIDHNVESSMLDDIPKSAAEVIERLQSQNENLRAVVSHMRENMETLGTTMRGDSKPSENFSVANAYVKNLEEELRNYKSKCRQLEQMGSDKAAMLEPSSAEVLKQTGAGDNMVLRNHIESLNNLIGDLRSEKTELAAQLRKQQTRIQHMESALEQQSKKPMELQASLEQAQYELGALERRSRATTTNHQQQMSALQLQLEEACREADEYHKASVQSNLEVTALNKQLSSLKLELADKRQPVSYGAQELMIQQLEDEIRHLREQQRGSTAVDPATLVQPLTQTTSLGGVLTKDRNMLVAQLQDKLRQAAKFISQLAREKQQLIEVGNRLRAELLRNGLEPPTVPRPTTTMTEAALIPPPTTRVGQTELSLKIQNKLNQLEQLQYEVTKQKLSLAQQKSAPLTHRDLTSTSTSHDSSLDHVGPSKQHLQPYWAEKVPSKADRISPRGRPSTAPERPLSPNRPVPLQHEGQPQMSARLRPSTSSGQPLLSSSGGQNLAMLRTSSSFGGESLQELWRMLDEEGTSPRPFTPIDSARLQLFRASLESVPEHDTQPSSTESFAVKGKPSKIATKPQQPTKTLSKKAQGKPGKKPTPKKKIRNYNVRDDSGS